MAWGLLDNRPSASQACHKFHGRYRRNGATCKGDYHDPCWLLSPWLWYTMTINSQIIHWLVLCTADQFVYMFAFQFWCVDITCKLHARYHHNQPPLDIFKLIWLEHSVFQPLAFMYNNQSSFQAGVCSSSSIMLGQGKIPVSINNIYVLKIHPKFSK